MQSQKHTESDAKSEASRGGGDAEGAVTPGSVFKGEGAKEFLTTGRTGRRNAMPDILGQHAKTGTGDLPSLLESLTTKSDQPSTSGTDQSGSSTSQQQKG
ncbi:Similar to PKIB: cAMP-dependent protein kinase inhibitor beta (Homo sapiens) [Cotesia congregata]|uniref:Similar to PKIB: cAMP-dependent protein kinase inhibitor beta (Homo sapiens) n=1 Tax=Cotesia congregata TaxID=51543 RepID=A0A8J2HHE5_COTCN|nr:Similar to PKIB: cAMP-dependent protein kinase inhibitor beta (Homo sapiens) [Cotesia congregata]